MNKKITENDLYAKLRKEREELYKIIGKEGITDQKVRIDKYAHLYVLQDEMTEYLRARRLSQAEIEKLYAVENFYEYIQNPETSRCLAALRSSSGESPVSAIDGMPWVLK